MIIFFDTETTGLPDWRMPIDHECQPHIVQIACILTEDDGRERASLNLIVDPGVAIPDGAARVHGITNEVAARCGVPAAVAVKTFANLLAAADVLVAHNIKFDAALLDTAYARLGGQPKKQPDTRFCTMDAATPIVNLPPTDRMIAAGFTKPKAPKLSECVKHFFNEELAGAHDALVDVRACARIYFHMQGMK